MGAWDVARSPDYSPAAHRGDLQLSGLQIRGWKTVGMEFLGIIVPFPGVLTNTGGFQMCNLYQKCSMPLFGRAGCRIFGSWSELCSAELVLAGAENAS